MIQRIQTVYLLIIVLVCGVLLFLPLADVVAGEETYFFHADGIRNSVGQAVVPGLFNLVFIVLLMIFNLVIIFLYKNRVLQIKLAKLNGILLAILIGCLVMSVDYLIKNIGHDPKDVLITYDFPTYLSFLPLLLNFLAIRSIRKDEELVRSADRLR